MCGTSCACNEGLVVRLIYRRDLPVTAVSVVLGEAPCSVSIAAGRTSRTRSSALLVGSGVCRVCRGAQSQFSHPVVPVVLASWWCGSGDLPWGCRLLCGSWRDPLQEGGDFLAWSLG